MKARWWRRLDDKAVLCELCPHNCVIKTGESGLCGVRENLDGEMHATQYAEAATVAIDPIEKKPLYHFHPGENILSVGFFGCNFSCIFCQNWQLSSGKGHTSEYKPYQLVAAALKKHSFGIAYTYNEPLTNLEYLLETAILARKNGLKNIIVSNGFINPEPLAELLPFLDGANIDVKSIEDEFYRKLCSGRLAPVLETVKTLVSKCHVELTYLVISTQNDRPEHFRKLGKWIADNCGRSTVLHFSAYYPAYKAEFPPTPFETLLKAREITAQYLDFVYLGNVAAGDWSDTYCPRCGSLLISRKRYVARIIGLNNGKCTGCGSDADFLVLN